MNTPTSKTDCPLCSQANHCGLEKGQDHCWCSTEGIEFPEELLQQLPSQQVGKSCICEACVRAFQARTQSK